MKEVRTKVGGQTLKLTNLDKVLYPNAGYTKAEVIQYYLKMAPIMFPFIRDRPLTTIRFPDGIHNDKFYSKSKPSWTPSWVASCKIKHDERSIDYVLVDQEATLVWLANLACLELHPMQFRVANNYCPDHVIVDLDPDESLDFEVVRDTTLELKTFLEKYDLTPFVKTSGGKGFHIIIPIQPVLLYDKVTEGIKKLAAKFVQTNPKLYTLSITKRQRKGKVLIDIYRNHLSNTTVAPYSLRGKPGAPISMPIAWDQVSEVSDAQHYNLSNYEAHLVAHGDLWKDWRNFEAPMYTGLKGHIIVTDNRLKQYEKKRDFKTTTEPLPNSRNTGASRFVLQLHDARNLHYDLRLEDEGVLLSWAIPKGLPFANDEKRLAIRTEDHPVAYLNYEGVIPKGSYGAGQMWIVDSGDIEWKKKKTTHYIFSLQGKYITQTFNLKRIKEEGQWLINLESGEGDLKVAKAYKPMLAIQEKEIPKDPKIRYEVKWDGIRALIYKNKGEIKIISRSGRDISAAFPELLDINDIDAEEAVLDGEIVVLDKEGRPLFHEVISRMHTKGETQIRRAQISKPVAFYAFDLIRLDCIDLKNRPLYLRQEWMTTIIKLNQYYRLSESFEDGNMLFQAIKAKQMEGIMAKKMNSVYHEGRSSDWIKIKCRYQDEAFIIGYTKSEGERSSTFGALHLAKRNTDDSFQYMGKVGTGFNQTKLKEIFSQLQSLPISTKLVEEEIEEEYNTVWVKPILKCSIEYASLTSNNTYREPVFKSIL